MGPALQGVKMMGVIIFIPCGPLRGPDFFEIEKPAPKNKRTQTPAKPFRPFWSAFHPLWPGEATL
jgi:hypothetical protein